jgi:FecR protein
MSDRERYDREPWDRMSDGDPIEALIKLTGPRPAVPPERAGRVKAAVFAQWEKEVRLRSRRRRLAFVGWSAAAAVLLASAGLLVWRNQAPPPPVELAGRIENVSNRAWTRPSMEGAPPPVPLAAGAMVPVGSELTTGADGRVAIRLTSGHSIRLDAETRVRMLSGRTVALERGAVYVESPIDKMAGASGVEIRTPLGDVHDVGTQFEVRLIGSSVRVRVREGAVLLRSSRGVHEVGAGRELELGADGGAQRPFPSFGEDWSWISGVTPPIAIEGRSLRDFLEWAAREKGLRLRYAEEDLPATAAAITLNGSIEGMTPDQALESILLTCRLTHRIDERGSLVVSRQAAGASGRDG